MRLSKIVVRVIVITFAIVGFVLVLAYLGVNAHLTDTSGIVDRQAEVFWESGASKDQQLNRNTSDFFNKTNFCILKILQDKYPAEFRRILDMALENKSVLAWKNLDAVATALDVGADGNYISFVDTCVHNAYPSEVTMESFKELGGLIDSQSPFVWASSTEWAFFKDGILKDKDVVNRIEQETGIKGRILVSQLVAEQMRLFYSDRAWFEKAISPVKVLASMSQFSWGVAGIKQETAIQVENNLKDSSSPFYLGENFEKVLDFTSDNHKQERFKRITNYHDHYYAYLYTTLYNKQIIAQWQRAGYDISDRPEILATLYNIGFRHSEPNANPQMGGAVLNLNGRTYSFGRLAYEFYYSGELADEFPQ